MKSEFKILDGPFVASLLRSSECLGSELLLRDIETLSDSSSALLHDLWNRAGDSLVMVATDALCEALENVVQVWCLDVHSAANPNCGLLIEDGEIFESTL